MKKNAYMHPGAGQFFAFNIWGTESARAVMDAAAEVHRDVILQTSMSVFDRLEKEELRAFVSDYMKKLQIRAYLHLDHCKRIGDIQPAVDAGWDSVMLDGSDQPLEENIRLTNEVCRMVHDKGVLVEAEVGQTGRAEEAGNNAGNNNERNEAAAGIARLDEIETFIRYTDADMLAVAVGTAHGLYRRTPQIHYELLQQTLHMTDLPLVIHGGTGLSDEILCRLLSFQNVKKINISTDVRQAYRQGILRGFSMGYMDRYGFDPLKISGVIHDTIAGMAARRMELLPETGR